MISGMPWALAGVAQWIECRPVNQRVAGLIPSQGTCLVCGPGPHLGVYKRQPHTDVSLPLSLPPFSFLRKEINRILKQQQQQRITPWQRGSVVWSIILYNKRLQVRSLVRSHT